MRYQFNGAETVNFLKFCKRGRKMKIRNYLIPGILSGILCTMAVTLLGCIPNGCMDVPNVDPTRPSASLTVIGGIEDQCTVNTWSLTSPITVHVSEGIDFSMMVVGNDDGGVKQIQMSGSYTVNMGGIQQRSDMNFAPWDYSECPKSTRVAKADFNWAGVRRAYNLSAWVRDFHGNSINTPNITVLHGE